MLRLRFFVVFMICLLALAPLTPALAQDAPPVLCGDLAAEDCALLEASAVTMRAVNAYTYNQQFHLEVADLPDVPTDGIDVTVTMDGQWAVDPAAQEAMLALAELSRSATPELNKTLQDELPAAVLEFLGGLAFDMNLHWSVSAAVAEAISADSDVPFPAEMNLTMRIVDGMFYLNLVELKPLIPDLAEVNADWIGFDLMGLMEQSLEKSAGDLTAEPMDPMVTALGGVIYQRLFAALEAFVAVERLEDVEVDGTPAAVFEFRPDLLGFFASDELKTLVADTAALMSSSEEAPSPAEVEESMLALSFMAPMLFRDLEVRTSTTIGLEDSYQYATTMFLRWELTNLLRLAAMGDDALKKQMTPDMKPAIEFSFEGSYGDFDQEPTIAAPADVEIIPLDQFAPTDEDMFDLS